MMTVFAHITLQILPDGRMDTTNAARYLGCSPKTLAHMRCSGKGPSYLKPGRVFYFQHDLDEWLAGHGRRRSTTLGAAAGAAERVEPPTARAQLGSTKAPYTDATGHISSRDVERRGESWRPSVEALSANRRRRK
jgi:hypothetical protein